MLMKILRGFWKLKKIKYFLNFKILFNNLKNDNNTIHNSV